MKEMRYIYGPVPSRRLGISLGVSPIPKKVCNYSCVYCQLGRTNRLTNTRQMFFPVEDIVKEFEQVIQRDFSFDVVTIVGEGEPTLYAGLGELITEIKKRTDKPVAVITNGALLYDPALRSELCMADIVLPTLDAYNNDSFKAINRPYGTLLFDKVLSGLTCFSKLYTGQLWIEIMLLKGFNDDFESFERYAEILKELKYEKLYINTPIRPPAEPGIKAIDNEKMKMAVDMLGGVSTDLLKSTGFHSEEQDDYAAILSIIKRHPMNQFEIERFLTSRLCVEPRELLKRLKNDNSVDVIEYKGYETYRLK